MSATEGILCSLTHEWIFDTEDVITIGITDIAIKKLGDVVFVELPEVEAEFVKGEVFATIESIKGATELYMPISGTVLEINEALIGKPDLINDNPFETGWLIKVVSPTAQLEISDLLEYSDYKDEAA